MRLNGVDYNEEFVYVSIFWKSKLYGRFFSRLVQSLSDHFGFSTEKCAVNMALHKCLVLVFYSFYNYFFAYFQ